VIVERRMDTVERRRFWNDVDVLAAQAKRLPCWMRGREGQSSPLAEPDRTRRRPARSNGAKTTSAAG
jgi:hypothetical protein